MLPHLKQALRDIGEFITRSKTRLKRGQMGVEWRVVEDEGGQWQGCSGRERHRSTRRGWGDGTFKDRLIASWRPAGCQRGRFGRQTRQRGQRERRTRPDRPIQPSATPPKHTDTRREREERRFLGEQARWRGCWERDGAGDEGYIFWPAAQRATKDPGRTDGRGVGWDGSSCLQRLRARRTIVWISVGCDTRVYNRIQIRHRRCCRTQIT